MAQDFFKQSLFAARVEREKLLAEQRELDIKRAELELRLDQLETTIDGLAYLSGDVTVDKNTAIDGLSDLSLADACRKVLSSTDRYMSPVRVRDELVANKYNLDKQSNPLASIHSIMKRFVESGEAEPLEVAGKTGYRWIRKPKDGEKADDLQNLLAEMSKKKATKKRGSRKTGPFQM